MASVTCHLHTVILVVAMVLILGFTDEIFHSLPVLVKLFTDPVNFILLVLLVILVLLIDLPCGILLSFLVLYLAIYVKRMLKGKIDSFENIVLASTLMKNADANTSANANANDNNAVKMLSDIPLQYLSESEINYNNTQPFPNKNISPFQPLNQQDIDTNTKQITSNMSCNQNDAITTVNAPNRNGYDVAGCRYDFKDSQQNMTIYGPPLAACGAYNPQQVAKCGTLFYPLNA